jgi:hypothetical protein
MAESREARWRRLHDYFDLQLRFAAAMADRGRLTLHDTLLRYTNLHRRLGLGHLGDAPPGSAWQRFVDQVATQPDHASRLNAVGQAYLQAPEEPPPPNQVRFGAFACNPPDVGGVVRIHFSPADSDDISPLSITRMSRRRAELRALTEYLLRDQPGARSVRGTSWLYNLEAYRRLFPPAYAASCRLNGQTLRYQGNALWGQFLSFRGEVKAAPRQRMLANLLDLDARRPWLTFPLPALTPEAPLAVFAEHYAED